MVILFELGAAAAPPEHLFGAEQRVQRGPAECGAVEGDAVAMQAVAQALEQRADIRRAQRLADKPVLGRRGEGSV